MRRPIRACAPGAILAALLCHGAVAPQAAAAVPLAPPLIFASDFDGGVVDPKLWSTSGNASSIETGISREGQKALETVLNRNTSRTSYRTELSAKVPTMPGGDYWYGFSVYLPKDYVADPVWELVAQWHSVPDNKQEEQNALNPPISLHTENGQWMVLAIWDSKPITDKKHYDGDYHYQLGPYATGKWTDWVFHVKWLPTKDGLLQVWKDGMQVINTPGPIGFNDTVGPYFKIGLYKGWRDRTKPPGVVSSRTLYHDAVRIAGPSGGSYDVVAPGTAAKLRPAAPATLTIQGGGK